VNVIKIDELPKVSKLKNKEEFVNKIIQHVVKISREDKLFSANLKNKKLKQFKVSLQEKNDKLIKLVEKSNVIKEEFKKQLDDIEEDNLRIKKKLIEQLGSEL